MIKKFLSKTKSEKSLEISEPSNVNHNYHVTVDQDKKFVGLPPEWEDILVKNNIK